MGTKEILVSIVTFLLVAGIAAVLYYKHKQSSKGKEEARSFLNGLVASLLENTKHIIADFNYDDYDSLVGIEIDIFNKMVEAAKKYITDELNKDVNILSVLALKALTPEFIDDFVTKLIGDIDIMKSVDSICKDKFEELEAKFAEEDKELDKEYSNNVYYINDENDIVLESSKEEELIESDDNGLEERGFVLPNKKEEEQLNPQSDEEESYDATDESMELVVEPETYVDSKGRLHDKSTGKYIKK